MYKLNNSNIPWRLNHYNYCSWEISENYIRLIKVWIHLLSFFFFRLFPLKVTTAASTVSIPSCRLHLPLSRQTPACPPSPHPYTSHLVILFPCSLSPPPSAFCSWSTRRYSSPIHQHSLLYAFPLAWQLHLQHSLLFLFQTAQQLSALSLKLNFSLKLLLQTQLWTTQGIFLRLIPPRTLSCLLLKFLKAKFSMPFLGLILGRLMDEMEYLLSFSKIVPLCWHPAWSNSSDSAYQLVPFLLSGSMPMCDLCLRSCDRSNLSSYRPIALISCLSKAFETILNRNFLKHLSSFNLLSDHQYGFRKGRSTGDLLAFLTDSLSSLLVVSVKLSLLP